MKFFLGIFLAAMPFALAISEVASGVASSSGDSKVSPAPGANVLSNNSNTGATAAATASSGSSPDQIICSCTGEIVPVCGTDSVTYRNICYLQCASRIQQQQGKPAILYWANGACPTESCICTKEYRPVCASDGKTYSNDCLFQCENRRRNALGKYPLTIRNNGSCNNCNHCPNTSEPLCANDENTYRNACTLKCENDARARTGLPPLQVKYNSICGCACKKYFDPVCGTDEATYDNICLLHCESNWKVYKGLHPIYLAYGGPCVCNCRNCPVEYRPVCGSDGRTYWNICWLNCYSECNLRKYLPKILKLSNGFC